MSDSEDENYVTFGVALDPLDEENFSRKKPVTIEDQYAYDAQGRRRFHGAFTGGFSAGYFNTVGTRDGWRPQQFKSSRSSKADNVSQRPEDFMDEEDTGRFGIAPQGIRATSDYADHGQRGVKRERVNRDSNGPIPGTPVLKELLKPVKDTVGIVLLKKMGWKPGQGVGSRITKKEKAKIRQRNERIRAFHESLNETMESSEDSEDEDNNITFAPDDYEPFRCNPKDNYFGIGYSGLERRNILSGHVQLFDAPAFSVQDKNKKLSIHGQAFGVGAFEADDEDIYEREDMSRYDFALGPERKTKSRWSKETDTGNSGNECVEGFLRAKNKMPNKKVFLPPELPKDFVPVHVGRKSRFYPPITIVPRKVQDGKRKQLTAVDRARILEDTNGNTTPILMQPTVSSVASNIVSRTLNLHGKQQTEERQRLDNQVKSAATWLDKLQTHSFIKGGVVGAETGSGSLKRLEDFKDSDSETLQKSAAISESKETSVTVNEKTKAVFSDSDKQRRFEQYLVLLKNGEKHKFESVQPLSMTEWDREHERTEFEQAVRLFDHSIDSVAHKFVCASSSTSVDDSVAAQNDIESEMKQAAKMKMFGKLTRERIDWKPASIVCKRFNIPEPKGGCAQPELQQKSTKFSIFDSLSWNASTKFTKSTDVDSPQVMKQTLDIKVENVNNSNTNPNVTKDVSFTDYQELDHVSEKMKSFEVSYEKIFGKGTQAETVTKISTDNNNSENTNVQSESIENDSIIGDNNTSTEKLTFKNNLEEKKDLFKAIFLSSSEDSDTEPEENVDEAVKSVLIGNVPVVQNIHRNTSPPRGIFAKVDLDNLLVEPNGNNKQVGGDTSVENIDKTMTLDSASEIAVNQKHKDDNKPRLNISEEPEVSNMYGPVLPARLLKSETATVTEATNSQCVKPVFRSVVVPKVAVDSKIHGKWVERSKVKKSKKEKKKHKHKEHKSSKHKRKSKEGKRSKSRSLH
ncbi:hypothetical protein KM043_017499 [Ampulex compressa]|nr:hypothetical protein KM043_017499 [Ampulex compressa]